MHFTVIYFNYKMSPIWIFVIAAIALLVLTLLFPEIVLNFNGHVLGEILGSDTSTIEFDVKTLDSNSILLSSAKSKFIIAIRNGLLRILTGGIIFSGAPLLYSASVQSPINDDSYHHVKIKRTPTVSEVYVDGVLQSAMQTEEIPLIMDVYIGGEPCDSNGFIGSVKNLRRSVKLIGLDAFDLVGNECVMNKFA